MVVGWLLCGGGGGGGGGGGCGGGGGGGFAFLPAQNTLPKYSTLLFQY